MGDARVPLEHHVTSEREFLPWCSVSLPWFWLHGMPWVERKERQHCTDTPGDSQRAHSRGQVSHLGVSTPRLQGTCNCYEDQSSCTYATNC